MKTLKKIELTIGKQYRVIKCGSACDGMTGTLVSIKDLKGNPKHTVEMDFGGMIVDIFPACLEKA